MFRKMRRSGQELPFQECEAILRDATHGVLSVLGDDGYPYGVPVNHVYADGKILFHCAVSGHKIDAIRRCDKVSFCVVAHEKILPEERATSFLSVIAFGRARIVDDPAGLRRIATLVGEKFSHDYPEACQEEIDEVIPAGRMYCVEIEVEHLSGKCDRREMMRRRQESKKEE